MIGAATVDRWIHESQKEATLLRESDLRHALRMADAAINETPVGEAVRFEEPPMSIDAEVVTKQAEKVFERTPEEIVADVLSRYSTLDLYEMSDESLERAEALLDASDKSIEVIDRGRTNLIRWWKVRSNGSDYEVRRFENFCFCSCRDFFFRKTVCRHIYVTTRDHAFKLRGEMDTAVYLKPSSPSKGEKIGKIRI